MRVVLLQLTRRIVTALYGCVMHLWLGQHVLILVSLVLSGLLVLRGLLLLTNYLLQVGGMLLLLLVTCMSIDLLTGLLLLLTSLLLLLTSLLLTSLVTGCCQLLNHG